MVKVILGSFGVFQIFKNLASRKRQVSEWKIHLHVDLCVIQFMWTLFSILSSRVPSPWASCVWFDFHFKWNGYSLYHMILSNFYTLSKNTGTNCAKPLSPIMEPSLLCKIIVFKDLRKYVPEHQFPRYYITPFICQEIVTTLKRWHLVREL